MDPGLNPEERAYFLWSNLLVNIAVRPKLVDVNRSERILSNIQYLVFFGCWFVFSDAQDLRLVHSIVYTWGESAQQSSKVTKQEEDIVLASPPGLIRARLALSLRWVQEE